MLLAVLLLVGCASSGTVPSTAGLGGAYEGTLFVDGRAFGANLTLRASGPNRVRGVFRTSSPVSIEGDVDGAVVDDLLRIAIEYRTPDGCDGEMRGILDISRQGAALDGPVTVSDCQDPVPARLVLRRRGARGPDQTSTGAPSERADS